MFYEYALEPAALTNWERVRYFLEALGPWRGRFLAEYPRKWKRMVIEALGCPDVEKHRIIERLRVLDKRALSPRQGAQYDGGRTWRDNAELEHRREPFHAVIVAADPRGRFITAEKVDDAEPLWRVEPGAAVPRTRGAVVDALILLLRASNHIAIVDPFFRADRGDKLMPLVELCRAVVGRAVAVDVHAYDGSLAHHESMRHARRAMPGVIPVSVTLRCWSERRGGERFHNRFLVTDIGGVQFGDSIEYGAAGQHDRLSFLGASERDRIWSLFYGPTPAFDLACPAEVIRPV